jgi:predicted O-methyltransferase YrrM
MHGELDQLLENTLHGAADSSGHVLTLFGIALGSKGKTFVELGVRDGHTTLPLLSAARLLGGVLHSVDISSKPPQIQEEYHAHWKFHQSDAVRFLETWDPNIPIDLVYVDDWHAYEHVKRELEILDRLVSPSTVILLHDLMHGNTCPFYHSDLTLTEGQWANGGPYRAVAELNPQFWEFATLPWCNGLTILRKKYSSKYRSR